ncbi:hypothetical protein M501DRAFT_1020798 [Patellaria atrata CBS 101060]|uniref:Uncharacterized protein n=1 Tax=Patellaria atrata CBS 101060 TaxID=1346257 RepID=A0A9P4S137_9PEZI|nr:hypothetical protein M501DRAFT_1020798 [Patellaria atrata CBS 101060]
MARKKRSSRSDISATSAAESSSSPMPPIVTSKALDPPVSGKTFQNTTKTPPSTSALIICRNKHWRYISSFHGPWLQLPPEVLESLAHSNYISPRPHPIDPAVFYDLVKIRKAVDEATNLAVRATSGLTSAALSNSLNAGNGILGGAAALGLGYGGGGGNAKLSRERKHRMRELATQKLSQAYHLDEIAASVATMQSASTLEDVAQYVLERSSADSDAKYVHFFHEKIPSRMMAQNTPLDPLNEIIAERPTDGAPLRTRALTRMFKNDYANAAKDLTESLAVCRYWMAQHKAGKNQLVLARTVKGEVEKRSFGRDWRQEVKLEEEDQPSSLEAQLLFHRAGTYFAIACQHIHSALDGLEKAGGPGLNGENNIVSGGDSLKTPQLSAEEIEAHQRRLEERKIVKTNAKRAIRDYISFLSHFDYTSGFPTELAEEFLRRANVAANGSEETHHISSPVLGSSSQSNGSLSDALVPHREHHQERRSAPNWAQLPPPQIYQLSSLFSPNPPPNLPPYPSDSTTLYKTAPQSQSNSPSATTMFADPHEAITYHPLLTDALHSLLLCHALLQTSPKELLRHAHNAARLARVCDGYPIFLAARSPSRSDWMEVLRRAHNWIGLSQSWEQLCKPAPLPGQKEGAERTETEEQKRERMKHEAILEALADDRVVDEESFQKAVRARERRAMEDEEESRNASRSPRTDSASLNGNHTNGNSSPADRDPPRRWAQEDGKEYPISTERAEAIARWVKEAPLVMEGVKRKGKKGVKGKKKAGLEESVDTFSVEDLGEVEELD